MSRLLSSFALLCLGCVLLFASPVNAGSKTTQQELSPRPADCPSDLDLSSISRWYECAYREYLKDYLWVRFTLPAVRHQSFQLYRRDPWMFPGETTRQASLFSFSDMGGPGPLSLWRNDQNTFLDLMDLNDLYTVKELAKHLSSKRLSNFFVDRLKDVDDSVWQSYFRHREVDTNAFDISLRKLFLFLMGHDLSIRSSHVSPRFHKYTQLTRIFFENVCQQHLGVETYSGFILPAVDGATPQSFVLCKEPEHFRPLNPEPSIETCPCSLPNLLWYGSLGADPLRCAAKEMVDGIPCIILPFRTRLYHGSDNLPEGKVPLGKYDGAYFSNLETASVYGIAHSFYLERDVPLVDLRLYKATEILHRKLKQFATTIPQKQLPSLLLQDKTDMTPTQAIDYIFEVAFGYKEGVNSLERYSEYAIDLPFSKILCAFLVASKSTIQGFAGAWMPHFHDEVFICHTKSVVKRLPLP